MPFGSREIAARIERAECRLLTDCAESARRRRSAPDVRIVRLASGVAVCTGFPSPLNKVAGLGFGGVVSDEELERVERAFAAQGMAVQVELSTLADPAVGELLCERGYVLKGFEHVLGRVLPTDGTVRAGPGIEIVPSGDDDLATWLDIVVTGFANPDLQGVPSHESFPRSVLEDAIGDMAGAPGFARQLALLAGEPVGGGSMRINEGVAQLCGAATVPAHRRKGVQTALLDARLARAGAEGCDVAVVTTLPGSKSQENVQRQGFALLYARAILVRNPS
jgi:GNAT superfamily N-acetyltransferase